MKESSFIKKNLDTWKEYEQVTSQKHEMPKKFSKLFVKITDDLSYAYTYYNNRSVRLYLNGVANSLFNRINKSEGFRFANVRKFFSHSVPLAIYDARREFQITFVLFVVSMLIGVLSSKYDPDFAPLILGDDYVSMTEQNIANGDPMAVYKEMAPVDMFFAITLNNCLVAIRTFVLGFFMAIGTIIIMLYNGIMVGTFQYFFVEHDMFKESFLTIWQHGVFEISSIIMSGAAGLVLGKGLVFPGNYTRFQSLRISARKGLKLMMGIIPILVIAGFIEGFYTRYTEAPTFLRVLTILLSLIFIIGYFIVIPKRRHRAQEKNLPEVDYIEAANTKITVFDKVFSASENFMLTFQQLKTHLKKLLKWCLLMSLCFPAVNLIVNKATNNIIFDNYYIYRPIMHTVSNPLAILMLILAFTGFSLLLVKLKIGSTPTSAPAPFYKRFFSVLVMQAIVHAPLFIPSFFFATLLYIVLQSYSSFVLSIYTVDEGGMYRALQKSFTYLKGSSGKFLWLSLQYIIMGILFYAIFNSLVVKFNNQFVQMNLYGSIANGYAILFYLRMFYFALIVLLVYAVFYTGNRTLYHSLHETITAQKLIERIKNIGNTKRIRGLIRE